MVTSTRVIMPEEVDRAKVALVDKAAAIAMAIAESAYLLVINFKDK